MNIDVTDQSPEQADQHHQQAQQEQKQQQEQQQDHSAATETKTVAALLISPSSPSLTSTVSPTESSILKNSSTEEADETTVAEADHTEIQQCEIEEQREKRGYGSNTVTVRQEERYQQSSPPHGFGVTLLAQCTPENVTTEKRAPEVEEVATSATVLPDADAERNSDEENALNNEKSSEILTVTTNATLEHELIAETLNPQPAVGNLSPSSSSSSTTSSPSSGGEDRQQVCIAAAERVSSSPTATVLAATNNNPMAEEDNEDEQPDSSSSSSNSSSSSSGNSSSSNSNSSSSTNSINNNDRFNNNKNNNGSASDTQTGGGDAGKVKVGDNESMYTSLGEEEGVPTSTATEIAPAQGEASVTLANAERTSVVVTHTAAAAAPLERVQTLSETADHSTPATNTSPDGGAKVLAAVHDDYAEDDDDEGVGLTSVATTTVTPTTGVESEEENNTISTTTPIIISSSAIVGGDVEGSSSPSSSTAPVSGSASASSSSSVDSTCTATTLSSSSSSSPTSSDPSPTAGAPQALAKAQQEPAANEPREVVADRQLCDSPREGHSFGIVAIEGRQPMAETVEAVQSAARNKFPSVGLPSVAGSPASMNPPPSDHLEVVNEDDDDAGGGTGDLTDTQPTLNSRPLTLAEELSQADAASSQCAALSSLVVAASAHAVAQPSAVAAVLPKSAAGTAAAATVAASSSSRSTSPIVLHSSLKKPNKMGVATGAAVTVAVAATNETRRRVSFPKDAQLITGYLDPVNPWACISICETAELLDLYRRSCKRHSTLPLKPVMEHLQSIDVSKGRVPLLSLKDQQLSYSACEALEEIFKHVQYRCIDLSHSGLDDVTASVMFDIIEYYEAANELDLSDNLQMSSKSWTACINMIKKSQALNVLITRGPTISDYQATNLAKALNTSTIHTLKLEHCVLSQQPIASLCTMLKRNTVLRELWLAHNQLSCEDAQQIASLLRTNYYIQLIDISNNRIGDKGVEHIVTAIVEQSVYFKDIQEKKRKSDLNFSDLSSSLNSINSAKNFFPQRLRSSEPIPMAIEDASGERHCSPTGITLTPPVTPPSTPAHPLVETSTEDMTELCVRIETTKKQEVSQPITATVYTIKQHEAGVQMNPPPPAPSPPTPPADAVAPPNVNLVETSTNNSVSLQTSDREKPTVERPTVLVTTEEEALLLSSARGAGARGAELVQLERIGGEKVQTDRSAPMDDESFELLLSLEPQSDSPVPQAPKKARLAKQDSVLSEFEAIATAMDTSSSTGELVEPKPKHESSRPTVVAAKDTSKVTMMEEDAPELCADYDDDGSNLVISQENLFVELGIPTGCEKGVEEKKKKLKKEAAKSAVSCDNEFAPRVVAPTKKDELQLLIEKSQKMEEQPEAGVEAQEEVLVAVPSVQEVSTPTASQTVPGRTRKCAISSNDRCQSTLAAAPSSLPIQAPKKDRTHSSSSDSIVGTPAGVRMVEVEIKDSVPLSRSFDSVGGDESDFESSSPFMTTATSSFPNERSFSSESLNSETSIDSNDSKSSLKIIESKFAAKNGTLERQQSNVNRESNGGEPASAIPAGLQVLVLWNNEITRNSVRHFSKLIEKTNTLDTLNVGSNLLCNNFIAGIGAALKSNSSLTNLGLQGAHLSDKGAKAMAEVIEFGGNASLQRIDLRNNNMQKAGLEALNEAMKSNKSVTRIDLDNTPRRVKDTSLDGAGSEYSRLVNNIRAQCERNKNPPEPSEPISTSVKRVRANYLSSRKISLTCPSIKTSPSAISGADKQHLLDPSGCKKTIATGGRLRSPLPSPIPSPIASPVPSPSRNRFHVSRVTDSGGGPSGSASSPSPSSTGSSPTIFWGSNSRFRVVTVAEPDLKSANNRSGSTISLPMSSGKSSPSAYPSMSIAAGGGIGESSMAAHRRPVCSSAPTLSSFPSPQSPLAAVPMTAARSANPSSPSPLLPPSSNTFHPTILPAPLMTAQEGTALAGSSPTVVASTLLPTLVNAPVPPHQQHMTQIVQPQLLQQLPPTVPLQQQSWPQFGPPSAPGDGTLIPLQYQQLPQHPLPVVLHPVTKYTTAPSPTILQQPQQQQQQQFQHTLAYPPTKVRHSSTPHHQSQHYHLQQQHHSSSSNSSTLHDSVLSSTSIESPDLEVKRFMSGRGVLDDSCCSSISSSSIDSIDNPHFISTSISSTDESFDLVVSSPLPVATSTGGSSCSSFSIVPQQSPSSLSSAGASRQQEEESTLIPRPTNGSAGKAAPLAAAEVQNTASLSSSSLGAQLNTASSQESLYDVHDLSASSNSSLSNSSNLKQLGGMKHQAAASGSNVLATPAAAACILKVPHAANNSNESTLTSVQSLEKEVPVKAVAEKAKDRVRKTSWILGGGGGSSAGGTGAGGSSKHTDSSSSGGSTPTPSGGSGYPPAIEKLLSIFHPSNLFSSSKASSASPPPHATEASSGSQPPSRKESPMGGLFHWAHSVGGGGGNNSSNNTSPTSNTNIAANASKDDSRGALKVNVSPETTLTPQQLQPLQNQAQLHYLQTAAAAGGQYQHQQSVEHMPPQLKVEMKENISPENTITQKLLSNVSAVVGGSNAAGGETVTSVLVASNSAPTIVAPPHTKVIFQLGGDYDESEDDIETLTNKYGNNATVGGVGQYFAGHQQSGPSSLLGSTTSNSSGISIDSGTSTGEITVGGMGPSPTPSSASAGQTSVSSETVLVLSHLGQLARDSLSMFKNPSLTSQESISARSMDSLAEITIDAATMAMATITPLVAVGDARKTASGTVQPPSVEASSVAQDISMTHPTASSSPLSTVQSSAPSSSPSSADKHNTQ